MSLSHRSQIFPHPFFSGFDDFFSTPFMTDVGVTPFLSNINRDSDMILRRSSPCYEVTENDKQFQLSVDVPGVKPADIEAHVENNGRVLRLTGGRKVKQSLPDGTVTSSESKFEKRFMLDQSVDITKITANLSDGVLVITAPKCLNYDVKHKINIVEGPPSGLITEEGEKAVDA